MTSAKFFMKLLTAVLCCAITIIYSSSYYDTLRYRLQNLGQKPLSPTNFLVLSKNCQMLNIDPFDNVYNFTPPVAPNCSLEEPLVVKTYNPKTKTYTLHIEMKLMHLYSENPNNKSNMPLQCCYRYIQRRDDKSVRFLPCVPFEQDFVVPDIIDYMLISCSENGRLVYQDGFTFIQERPIIKNKLKNYRNYTHRSFGILLYGIDSVSQFNFRRVMPKTFQYVQNNSWFELSGYNKIDDNTFPNLMAILTGYNSEETDSICNPKQINGLDNCRTLFKLFNEQGLITAYSEDECFLSTFTYLKPGFSQTPTDYYQRPLLIAIEKTLPSKKFSGLHYCIGPRRSAEYVYDFSLEFAERFLGKPIFGLFWTNTFSHTHWQDPYTMDQRMVNYFSEMNNNEILENNVVVLFSDHGARWGFLRSTKDGYYEERLPMFFLRLPQWFQQKYPQYTEAFKINKHRLTSPFDIHMTLKHLALLAQGQDILADTLEPALSCPTCHTLFKPAAEDRNCAQAGITDHWCTCTPFQRLDTNSNEMEYLTKLVIKKMNIYLSQQGYGKKCARLKFKNNLEANLMLKVYDNNYLPTYRMNFNTLPYDAEFDATFVYNKYNKSIIINVPEISRLNTYAKSGKCITDNNIIKKFCMCYNDRTENIHQKVLK